MNVRRPLALFVPLALSAVLLVGCGDDDAGPDEGASDSSSETSTPSEESTESVSDPAESDAPTDDVPETDSQELPDGDDGEGGDGRTDVPADAADLCGAFDRAMQAFEDSAADITDESADVPPALLEAFRQWGRDLADADLPSGFNDQQRQGVQVMSDLLVALPDTATFTELSGFEDELSDADEDAAESVQDYVDQNCGLDG